MKKFLSLVILLVIVVTGNAQVILCQDFAKATPGWVTSNGSSIAMYNNVYNNCIAEYGIITPGVGGNNPAKVLSEIITPNQQLVEAKFNIDRYDANLSCASHSDFGCPTSVDILAVNSTYNGTNPIGDGATIYANYSGYLIPISGGTVSLILTLPANLPTFRLFYNFSTNNCNQSGTKYVLDKFCFTGLVPCQIPNTCPPVANLDFFVSGAQGFTNSTLLANVYGTNLAYTPPAPHTSYVKRSLTHPTISPAGGKDYDIDNHPLSAMTFSLLSQTFTAAQATFTFNSDGTFSFLRLNPNINQFFFNYQITDPTNLSATATVRIDYSQFVLPVTLTDFNVAKKNTSALLNWKTAQEQNNKGFDILRKTSGAFEKIGFVASKAPNGNSSTAISYSFEDKFLPNDKAVYYRLAQVDFDGKQTLSDIRLITNGDTKQPVLVYPNPSRGNLKVIIPADVYGLTDIRIIDAAGSVVQQISNTANKNIDITGLQPGFYILKIYSQSDNSSITKKLIVQ